MKSVFLRVMKVALFTFAVVMMVSCRKDIAKLSETPFMFDREKPYMGLNGKFVSYQHLIYSVKDEQLPGIDDYYYIMSCEFYENGLMKSKSESNVNRKGGNYTLWDDKGRELMYEYEAEYHSTVRNRSYDGNMIISKTVEKDKDGKITKETEDRRKEARRKTLRGWEVEGTYWSGRRFKEIYNRKGNILKIYESIDDDEEDESTSRLYLCDKYKYRKGRCVKHKRYKENGVSEWRYRVELVKGIYRVSNYEAFEGPEVEKRDKSWKLIEKKKYHEQSDGSWLLYSTEIANGDGYVRQYYYGNDYVVEIEELDRHGKVTSRIDVDGSSKPRWYTNYYDKMDNCIATVEYLGGKNRETAKMEKINIFVYKYEDESLNIPVEVQLPFLFSEKRGKSVGSTGNKAVGNRSEGGKKTSKSTSNKSSVDGIDLINMGMSNVGLSSASTSTTTSPTMTEVHTREKCWNCNGSGRIKEYINYTTFDSSERRWCAECQEYYVAATAHVHKDCPICLGSRYVDKVSYEYK